MSTDIYLECQSHVPPLVAEDESGQHLYDLPRIREEVADRDTVVERYEADEFGHSWSFENNTARFLALHKTCAIGIRDEYGRSYPLVEESE